MHDSGLVTKFDLSEASIDSLLAICFSKTTAQNYSISVELAKSASRYKEILIEGKLYHFAVFSKTREDAARAISVINSSNSWKSFQIFTGGKLVQDYYTVLRVLSCYLSAEACNDWTAHCCDVIDDPFLEKLKKSNVGELKILMCTEKPKPTMKRIVEVGRFLFPCKFIQPWFNFQVEHPASIVDQIHALAISKGTDWCPLFSPGNFKKVGERREIQEVFD